MIQFHLRASFLVGRFESEFVEQRRYALEVCLRRIAAHHILSKSVELKMFLECIDLEADVRAVCPVL